jgi:hypothetical protein
VVLSGKAGEPIEQTVMIIPREEYPFKLIGVKARIGKFIRHRVEDYKGAEGEGYLLTLENLKKTKGRYYDSIHLKTDNKTLPEIVLTVYGNIIADNKAKEKHTKTK